VELRRRGGSGVIGPRVSAAGQRDGRRGRLHALDAVLQHGGRVLPTTASTNPGHHHQPGRRTGVVRGDVGRLQLLGSRRGRRRCTPTVPGLHGPLRRHRSVIAGRIVTRTVRPHRTHCTDATYLLQTSNVPWSVCVENTDEPSKTAESIEMLFVVKTLVSPKEP